MLKKLILTTFLVFLSYGQSKCENFIDNDFIKNIKPQLEIRPRFDWTSKKTTFQARDNAIGLITRINLGAHLDKLFNVDGLQAYIEFNHVSDLFDQKRTYNNKQNDSSYKYAFIADPSIERLTEAKISYTLSKTNFLFGRLKLNLDDQRFISDANWRQTPQSFGILGIQTKELKNLDLLIALIYERKWWAQDGLKSYLDTGGTRTLNMAVTSDLNWGFNKAPIIIHGCYTISPMLKITGYYYDITDIHKNWGGNLKGDIPISKDIKINYLAEYAKQTDPSRTKYLNSKPDVDGNFYRVDTGFSIHGLNVKVGYYTFSEWKNNGATRGFSTPFTTFHLWEGWADILAPGTANGFYYGLKTFHVGLSYNHKNWGNFNVNYYNFKSKKSAPDGVDKYGEEIDLQYTKKLTKKLTLLLKSAIYDGNGVAPNLNSSGTTKIHPWAKDSAKYWIMFTYKF